MRIRIIYSAVFLLAALILFPGCDYKGEKLPPQNPFTQIYNIPPDSSILSTAFEIWWWGTDRDGRILGYDYVDFPHSMFTANQWDELTQNYDSLPQIPDSIQCVDGKYVKWLTMEENGGYLYLSLLEGEDTTEHLFCVRAFDNDSARSESVCRIYYRTNERPDTMELREIEGYEEGDTFWVLDGITDDWGGIPFSWRASDPDNSILLEFNWWVENYDNPFDIARSSLAEDSLNGVYAGLSPTDGWVASSNTSLYGIPSGHWRFIIKVRDDAFYEGAADTFEFYTVHPYFDPSDSAVVWQMYEGEFEHRMLFIHGNNTTTGFTDEMFLFYDSLFTYFGSNRNYYDVYQETEGIKGQAGYVKLLTPKWEMKNYSIIYLQCVSDNLAAGMFKWPDPDLLEEFREYVQAGGRVIFDGRDMLRKIAHFAGAYSPYGQIPFDMFGISWMGSAAGFDSAYAIHPEYKDLDIDTSRYAFIGSISAVGVYPYFSGVPFAEALYCAGNRDDPLSETNLNGLPIACRFAKTTTRTAFFGFPLCAMDNSQGSVTDAMDSTLSFVSKTFNPDTCEQEESLLRFTW